jgi:hypothetical protein
VLGVAYSLLGLVAPVAVVAGVNLRMAHVARDHQFRIAHALLLGMSSLAMVNGHASDSDNGHGHGPGAARERRRQVTNLLCS